MSSPTATAATATSGGEFLTLMLGEAVQEAQEETFLVFSQELPSQSLGFVDAQTEVLSLCIGGHDLTIHQSRGLLTSDRRAGTTGAVVWQVTPLFASWMASADNFLFTHKLVSCRSTAVELGAGASGIVGLALGPRISRYTATDQDYVVKLLKRNIAENGHVLCRAKSAKSGRKKRSGQAAQPTIMAQVLDWETDDVSHLRGADVVIACDCVYNESLIEPLNSTCAALCRPLPPSSSSSSSPHGEGVEAEAMQPRLCIMAQQLRSADVFEAWLQSFLALFEVWRVPDGLLSEELRQGSGFVVHIGIVR